MVYKSSKPTNSLVAIYFLITLVSSLPFIFKRFQSNLLIAISLYTIFLALVLVLALKTKDNKIFNKYAIWIGVPVALFAFNFFAYPATRLVANPSTAPNAIIEPALAIFNGTNPYSITLFDGAPISPGPGWILINTPVTLINGISLLTPLYLLVVGYLISKTSNSASFSFMILLTASLAFLQMNAVGHDLLAACLAFVALSLAAHRYHDKKLALSSIAILTGIVATARVPFIIFPITLAICLREFNKKDALKFALIAVSTAIVIHLIFYSWCYLLGLRYQPLHVFGRGSNSGSILYLSIAALTWVGVSLYFFNNLSKSISSWMAWLWATLSIPFIFVGAGELLRAGGALSETLALWEGKGYVMFTLPLLAAQMALNTDNSRQ